MKTQTEVVVFMNGGRWIFHCPSCGVPLLAEESGVVCPKEYPNIRARAFQPLTNGLLRQVHDTALIEQTRAEAENAGQLYFPVYPEERQQIEAILRLRSNAIHMNWTPDETIEFLVQENIEHSDPLPKQLSKQRKK